MDARVNIALEATKSKLPRTRFSAELKSLVNTIPVRETKIMSSSGLIISNNVNIDLIFCNFMPLPSIRGNLKGILKVSLYCTIILVYFRFIQLIH